MSTTSGMWAWRKASFSQGNGNSACVEVGRWRSSSFSQGNANSACVEVAWAQHLTAVRDSKNPAGGMLAVPDTAWETFRASITD